MPKRLVIFVEGKGDVKAVPALARRVVSEIAAYDALLVDPEPFRVVGVATLVKGGCEKWHDWLEYCGRTRPNLGGVLLVLDGDADRVPLQWTTYTQRFQTTDFCARRVAAMLGDEARAARAGGVFSLASVFAMKEFETWLLAGIESLRGTSLAEGRGMVPNNATFESPDIEQIRGAKERLKSVVPGYDQSLDQAVLAKAVDLEAIRRRSRSFRRFCSAVRQLADAIRNDAPVITPVL